MHIEINWLAVLEHFLNGFSTASGFVLAVLIWLCYIDKLIKSSGSKKSK